MGATAWPWGPQRHCWDDEPFDRLEIGLTLTGVRSRRIRRANAAVCCVLGRSQADLVGTAWDALDPPPCRDGWVDMCQRLSGMRPTRRHLVKFVRLDGAEVYALITTVMVTHAYEPCCLGQIFDITDISITDRNLRLMLKNSPSSISLLDKSYLILEHGGGAVRALADDLNASRRSSIFKVFAHSPESLAMVRRAMDGAACTGTTEAYGGYYDIRMKPIRNAAGEVGHVVTIATDVTERERARADQSTLTELAHQALRIVEPEQLWNHAATALASRLGAAVTVHVTEAGREPHVVAAVGALPPAAVTAAAVWEVLLSAPSNCGDGTGAGGPRRTGQWSTVSLPVGRLNAPAAVLTVHRADGEPTAPSDGQLDERGSRGPQAGPFDRREMEFVDAVASVLGAAAVRFAMEREANYRALHDSLTDLPNRVALLDRLGHSLKQRRNGDLHAGVIFVDLDGFKAVNDTLGHRAGDDVLRETADRLRASVRPDDVVARLAGDEFAILCERVSTVREVEQVAHRVIAALAKPITLPETDAVVTASAGVAISGAGLADADRLLNASDIAMYTAKRAGPGHCVVYHPAMRLDPETSPGLAGHR